MSSAAYSQRKADIGSMRVASLALSCVLLIWLLQQTTICSVEVCPDLRFPRRYANSKLTSAAKKPANSTWRPVGGPMASSALDADIDEPTNWWISDGGSVLAVGIKYR